VVKSDPFPAAASAEEKVDRRRFLRAAGCAVALATAGEWLARRMESEHFAGAAPEVELARADAPAVGESVATIDDGGAEVLVVQVDAGTTVAFDRRCPHLGCPVLWAAERGRFECPCHHAAFDARTGEPLFGPPRRALRAAKVRVA
jgi:Rieske Fe-S protein